MSKNKDLQNFRRQMLAAWFSSNGGISYVCSQKQLSSSSRSHLYNALSGYCLGVVAARKFEKLLGLSPGFLDPKEKEDENSQVSDNVFSTNESKRSLKSTIKDSFANCNTRNTPIYPSDNLAIKDSHRAELSEPKSWLMHGQQPNNITDFWVSETWIKKNIPTASHINNLYMLTGTIDSKNPHLKAGDPLLIDAGVKEIESDSIYLFKLNGKHLVKRLQLLADRTPRIMYSNAQFDSVDIEDHMDFSVLGKVLKIWRSDSYL